MAPATDTPFVIGKIALAGASAVGLGALCYYGLGLSNDIGALERSVLWTELVKTRIRDTYMYFGGSIAVTAGAAVAAFRTPAIMNLVMRNGWVALVGTMAAMIGTGALCRSIRYEKGIGMKQLAWMLHCGVMGAVVAPLCFLGGPLLIRALWYTTGVVGGLSCVAMCAPSDKFLSMGAPLGVGLGVVLAGSIGSWLLPPTSMLGAGLYSVAMYGGLILFSAFLLHDTQRIVRAAEMSPAYVPFDPINAQMSIYMDTMNIFIRIATLLAGGGNRRR